MTFEYNPTIKILLQGNTKKKVSMEYREHTWMMPKVAKRPPYFMNPQYGWDYPII
ncbi:hypothetical protein J2T56_000137 [Natronobacillus azotifigens]|uniref:Uncharacterized protein n=1 Tax=Natronobacillus azotifigens TaxID=472978 RepID=A0A9J6R7X6_9BACI|nr:hypothetical protein [Natronobacillus azotifigens]MCZ0701655.1 hypothetical protein [Natronobacillus azotifigens]